MSPQALEWEVEEDLFENDWLEQCCDAENHHLQAINKQLMY